MTLAGSLETVAVGRLDASFGARVTGIDLAKPLAPGLFARLRDLLHEHQLLVLPEQRLSQAEQVAFSRHFGELQLSIYDKWTAEQHPEVLVLSNIVEGGKAKGLDKFGRNWHTDLSYMARPTYATMLYAVEVPAAGGDTMYASMVAAYDAMPEAERARLEGTRFSHSVARQHARHYPKDFIGDDQKARAPDVSHPVIRQHPFTGRKALYLGGETIAFPEGLDDEAGQRHLAALIAYATQERFVYRHRWAVGDLVIWDNASVMHRATEFDGAVHRRLMHRTSVEGTVPF